MVRWLDVKNIEGGYGSVKIIHGIDMHVDEGEFVTIIGPNGCGKSTLIKIIFGIATHYGGVVKHKGEDVSGWRTDILGNRGIAYVPQVDNVFPSLSVEENLQMGGNSLSTSVLNERIGYALEMFPDLQHRTHDMSLPMHLHPTCAVAAFPDAISHRNIHSRRKNIFQHLLLRI